MHKMRKYSEYKYSGMKWIGDIPKHWEVRLLSQMATLHYLSNKEVHHQNLLSLSYGRIISKDINGVSGLLPASYDTYQIVEDGNIVLRLTDLQNDQKSLRVGLCTQEGIITSAYLALQPRETVLPAFLYLLLHAADIMKVFYSMGNGLRQNLNWGELRKLSCVLPPLSEQRAIVSYLDSKVGQIDTYVAKQTQQIELLKELKQAVIANAVTKGIGTNPNAKRKQSGVNWLGEIPEHWEVSKLRKHFIPRIQKVSDKDFAPLSVTKDGILPQLDTACKTDNGENRKLVRKGDYVVNSRSDRKGSGGISPFDGSVSLINIVIYPIDGEQEYYHYLFRCNNFVEEFYRNGRGIVADLWTTRYQEMKNIEIPIPPLSEQRAIVSYIEAKTASINKLIDAYEQQVERVKEYKQRLISDAVTGKINVTDEQTQTN